MDGQFNSPNIPSSAERPAGFTPEDLQVSGAPRVEAAPAPAPAPAAANAGAPAAPKLTAADVAAAIAATPTAGVVPTASLTPSIAGDVDVIEPEWVDKAEEVVRTHQGDPYQEEEAIEALQEDYMKKRYGINVADPNAGDNKPKGA